MLRLLTPRMDRLIAVSRSIVEKLHAEGRDTIPISLIHNGVDLERYDHQEPCCTLPRGVRAPGRRPGRRRRGPARAGEGPPDAHRGLAAGRGRRSRRDAPRRRRGQPARRARGAGDRAPRPRARRVHRSSRRRPGRDGRARRRGPAVLPRSARPDHPRGDGPVPPGRRLERGRDPGDGRGRGDRAARAAARRGRALPARSSACCGTTRWPTRSGGRGTTWSTPSSASSSWSTPSSRSTTTVPARSGSARSPPDRTIG